MMVDTIPPVEARRAIAAMKRALNSLTETAAVTWAGQGQHACRGGSDYSDGRPRAGPATG